MTSNEDITRIRLAETSAERALGRIEGKLDHLILTQAREDEACAKDRRSLHRRMRALERIGAGVVAVGAAVGGWFKYGNGGGI